MTPHRAILRHASPVPTRIIRIRCTTMRHANWRVEKGRRVSTEPVATIIDVTEEEALALDAADPLAHFRERFHLLPGRIYLDGNSLGLLSRDAEAETLRALEQWKTLGIDGWLGADPPWFTLGEELGALSRRWSGPTRRRSWSPARRRSTSTPSSRPSTDRTGRGEDRGDHARLPLRSLRPPASQIRLHGGDPERRSRAGPTRDGRTIEEADLIAALGDDTALAMLPAVLYRSGQLFDIPRLRPRREQRLPGDSTARTRSARSRTASTSGTWIRRSGAPTST